MVTDPPPPPPLAPGLPPAGWYSDGIALRWWDGNTWGPYAPPAPSSNPFGGGTTLSVLAHASFFFASIILPLILRLTEGKKDDYLRHHSTEALNFQLTFLIAWLSTFVLIVITAIATAATSSSDDSNGSAWFLLPFAFLPIVFIAGAVFSVLGAVRASQGQWWRYPVSIRFVRGAKERTS
jgi:uncharacterized Tic20 family protein